MDELLDQARIGVAGLDVSPALQARALANLERWLTEPMFSAYVAQLQAMIEAERWGLLADCFGRVLPFGTGGRRGTVGIGPNRFNSWTLSTSVQGHALYLRETLGDKPLSVVIAFDVRSFDNLKGELIDGVPSSVMGMTSRAFAEIAAEVYAAQDITVWLPEEGFLSTPELSFAIRCLKADGGLNVSASHNPPDDNGGKFYNNTGAQEVPPRDHEMAELVSEVTQIERMPLDRARAVGLVKTMGPEVREGYLQANLSVSANPGLRSARIVYSPLQGTGGATVYEVLHQGGFDVHLEPSQTEPDGSFDQVPHRAPNPELASSMEAAVKEADRVDADIVMASDPDADRIGLMVRHPLGSAKGNWRFFNGNEIGALITRYALRQRKAEAPPIVLKTEVTSSLITLVAEQAGAKVVDDLLVGFKYIGDALDRLETKGRFRSIEGSVKDFVLGAEESHGILLTPQIRDKDAAGAALLLAEFASLEKAQGRTLVDALREIWRDVGYVRNTLRSTVMRGAKGRENIHTIQQMFRDHPIESLAGHGVIQFEDRQDPDGPWGPVQSPTDATSRDVLVWHLQNDARVILRPSGTEPKNKIYVEVRGAPGADLSEAIPEVNQRAQAIGDAFLRQMLALVNLSLPSWALQIDDLMPIEHKLMFAERILPELLRVLDDETIDVNTWLEPHLKPLGPGARRLLLPGVLAYIQLEQPNCWAELRLLFES